MKTKIKISDVKNSALLISDVLHLAADEYLATCFGDATDYKTQYSCNAICAVLDDVEPEWEFGKGLHGRIMQGLQAMGCDTESSGCFKHLEQLGVYDRYQIATPESQQARYFWLKWAALQAESQGE